MSQHTNSFSVATSSYEVHTLFLEVSTRMLPELNFCFFTPDFQENTSLIAWTNNFVLLGRAPRP
jgi:hypothetical protein